MPAAKAMKKGATKKSKDKASTSQKSKKPANGGSAKKRVEKEVDMDAPAGSKVYVYTCSSEDVQDVEREVGDLSSSVELYSSRKKAHDAVLEAIADSGLTKVIKRTLRCLAC
jgi:hypothetical protein